MVSLDLQDLLQNDNLWGIQITHFWIDVMSTVTLLLLVLNVPTRITSSGHWASIISKQAKNDLIKINLWNLLKLGFKCVELERWKTATANAYR